MTKPAASRLMIVEDEMIIALDIQANLRSLGYDVACHASSGEEAVRMASESSPDLILMDINLKGGMDGIDTALRIREASNVPVVFVTAYSDTAVIDRAKLIGAHGFLLKPFEKRDLHSSIEIALYKHSMEAKLRESEERYALVLKAMNEGVWDWDTKADSVFYSARWMELLGLGTENHEAPRSLWLDRVHPEDQVTVVGALADRARGPDKPFGLEFRMLHRDGDYRWMSCRGLTLFDKEGVAYRLAGSMSDITEKKGYEHALEYKALNDELTRLPNRVLFVDRLAKRIAHVRRHHDEPSAVFFLDIDHFKYVNDSYGHALGDELLKEFARRLEACMREGDTVARFGGDEFTALTDKVNGTEGALLIAGRMNQAFEAPFRIKEREVHVNASIGIVLLGPDCGSPEAVLQDADTAMYFAKNKGRGCFVLFEPRMHEFMLNRLDTERDLRTALEKGEFILHYQPIHRIGARAPIGFEALIRWRNPDRGMVPPDDFIPVAEQTKLIVPIGEWVLRTACAQMAAWNSVSGRSMSIAVNVSRIQLYEPTFLAMVGDALAASGLEPGLLELEITESSVMSEIDQIRRVLEALLAMGVRLSIDDFGTGYSSFGHLNRFPASSLKIDKSFIDKMESDDHAIVSAIIVMGHKLKLKIIGEGVETAAQFSILEKLGCDEVQGYLFGKGIPAEDVQALLSQPGGEDRAKA